MIALTLLFSGTLIFDLLNQRVISLTNSLLFAEYQEPAFTLFRIFFLGNPDMDLGEKERYFGGFFFSEDVK